MPAEGLCRGGCPSSEALRRALRQAVAVPCRVQTLRSQCCPRCKQTAVEQEFQVVARMFTSCPAGLNCQTVDCARLRKVRISLKSREPKLEITSAFRTH